MVQRVRVTVVAFVGADVVVEKVLEYASLPGRPRISETGARAGRKWSHHCKRTRPNRMLWASHQLLSVLVPVFALDCCVIVFREERRSFFVQSLHLRRTLRVPPWTDVGH